MTAHAQRLKLRLFIEGVELPIIACQVEARPNSPVVGTIQIPPLAEGTRFLPRSLVHVFFLDFYGTANPNIITTGAQGAPTSMANPSAYTQGQQAAAAQGETGGEIDDYVNQQYKLLFVGEVVAFKWTKNASNRSLVLQCLDPSNYWDYAYQWNNTDIFGPGIKALFSGGSTNLFTDFLTDEGSILLQLLRQKSRNFPNMAGGTQNILSGLISMLEAVGGTYFTKSVVGGMNMFFSLAEIRLHITQLITAFTQDKTPANLMNADGYDPLFGRTLGNLGSQVSFRDALNALQGMIFYETYGQPCPMYVPGSFGTVNGSQTRNLTSIPSAGDTVAAAQKLITSLSSFTNQVQTFAAGNGSPNVDPTETLEDFLNPAIGLCTSTLSGLQGQQVVVENAVKQYFITGRKLLQQMGAQVVQSGSNLTLNTKAVSTLQSLAQQATVQFQKVLSAQVTLTQPGSGIPARLNQQIFRPDVWFSAPPRCNVIFPDQYTQLDYSRAFLAEPTRFLLKTNDEFFGEDELFDQFYFAPKSPTVKQSKAQLQALLANDLMDHELFCGILPVFEKMGELNIFAGQSGTTGGKLDKIGLAQRSTNFLYFKHRFSARQMSVRARFNPYIACGFPGLILDKYVDVSVISRYNQLLAQLGKPSLEASKLLGTHFLANFTEVTHNIDQRSATTEITAGYARQVDESVEFLGTISPSQTVVSQYQGDNATKVTVVAALSAPPVGSLGPTYGVVQRSIDVTAAYSAANGASQQPLPFYKGPSVSPGNPKVTVPVGITQLASAYGSAVSSFIGDPNEPVLFHAYQVEEAIPQYRKSAVDIPPEEYIRPGWYGPCWSPANIGQVYNQFFATGAITDPISIGSGQGANMGGQDSTAQSNQANQQPGNPFDPNSGTNLSILNLDPNSTIEQAAQFLVLTYSFAKQAPNVDMDAFILAYVWRPIASIVDMFGTSDLTLSTDGSQVLRGFEGFHSRAFGQYNNLFGLVTPSIENILGMTRGSTAATKADTRKRKQDAVLDYLSAIQLSRAILG
jgi:hypothetical protein